MTTERIKEIQKQTAHPNSISVQQALLQVWNECEQENNEDAPIVSSLLERAAGLVGNPGTNISGSTDVACEQWQRDFMNFRAQK